MERSTATQISEANPNMELVSKNGLEEKSLSLKEKLQKEREEKHLERYIKNIRPGLKKKARKQGRLHFTDRYSQEYKELKDSIEHILSCLKRVDKSLGRDDFLYKMGKSVVDVQRLFEGIKYDLSLLDRWEYGNPWFRLNKRASEALKIGFARKMKAGEREEARNRNYKGTYIRFKKKSDNGRYEWTYIVPEYPDSDTGKAVFNKLHQLRIKCAETAQR